MLTEPLVLDDNEYGVTHTTTSREAMSEYLYRMEIYEGEGSRISVIERKSDALPYTRLDSSNKVHLLPPHPVLGPLTAIIECDTITQDHPYVGLQLDCKLGKGKDATAHLLKNGWRRTTVGVVLAGP